MAGGEGILSTRWRALTIGLFLTIFVAAIEALSVATVMPLVEADLQDLVLYGWVFSAFFLGQLLGISLVAQLMARGPVRLPLALGLLVFATGLAIASLAPSMAVLVAARVLQGVGAGAIPAVAFAVIGRAYPDELRPKMFAVVSTAWVVPALFGPVLAGFVAERFGWRWVFAGLLPFVALAGGLAVRAVRTVPGPAGPPTPTSTVRGRLVVTALLAASAALALTGVSLDDLRVGLPLGVVGVAGAAWAFGRLTPRGTLRVARGIPAGIVVKGLLVLAFFGGDAFVPYALVDGRGQDIHLASLTITTVSLCWTAGAWAQARLVLRSGPVLLCRAGFGLLALGLAGMVAVMAPEVPPALALPAWGFAGLGIGVVYGAVSGSVLATAPPNDQGEASAWLQLAETLGIAVGTGVAGATVSGLVDRGTSSAGAAAVVFAGAGVVALVGLAVSGRTPSSVRRAPDAAEAIRAG